MGKRAASGAVFASLLVSLASCNAILGNEAPTPRDGAAAEDAGSDSPDAPVEAVAPIADAGCAPDATACGTACSDLSTDIANCGACGVVCEDGCSAGLCVPKLLLGKIAAPFGLALDSANVYVLDRGATPPTGRIVRVPFAGGAPADIATNLDRPYAIAADATAGVIDVYWSVQGTTPKVSRYRGTAPTDLPNTSVSNGVSGSKVRGLFVDTAALWGSDDKLGGRVWRATRGGIIDTEETVATAGVLPATIEVKSGVAYAVERLDGMCSAASSIVSWTPGSAHVTAVPGGACPYGMTVIAGDVFFTERNSPGTLKRNGTTAPLAEQLVYPNAVVSDNVTLYWTNLGAATSDGSLERIDVAPPSRPRATIATGRSQPIAIAIDKTYVYWLELGVGTGNGELYRLRR